MSRSLPRNPYGLVLVTLVVALVLTVSALPAWASDFRPQWVALTLLYWTLTLPDRVGIFWAWGTGLVLDIATDAVLGQQALSLSVAVYFALRLHLRIRAFSPFQQALSVWMLLLVERLLSLWVYIITGGGTPGLGYWIAPFVGMLLWPLVFILLRDLGRRFGVVI